MFSSPSNVPRADIPQYSFTDTVAKEQPRILIVEDELLIAELLSRKLRKIGFQVLQVVTSGEEAIAAADKLRPDLIMMDIVIRGEMDGIKAAEVIFSEYDIPIIFLTAYADDRTLERAEGSGCYGYLLKPVKERELKVSIRVALQKHLQNQQSQDGTAASNNASVADETLSPDMLALREDLSLALKRNELIVYYQPLIDFKTRSVIGAEALLRWQHAQKGMISPGVFIPIAESSGLIDQIGEWVIRQACRQAKVWMDRHSQPFRIAVNLSAKQFRPELIAKIQAILQETQIPPICLAMELTENILIDQSPEVVEMIEQLKSLGLSLSIDDFGTGYSSMAYLQKYPFDTLKIDRCFVQNINNHPEHIVITKAIIEMAQGLNLKIVAEGVELEEEFEFLKENQCDIAQGFLFSRPVPPLEFEAYAFGQTE